jgi:hypothetical protein
MHTAWMADATALLMSPLPGQAATSTETLDSMPILTSLADWTNVHPVIVGVLTVVMFFFLRDSVATLLEIALFGGMLCAAHHLAPGTWPRLSCGLVIFTAIWAAPLSYRIVAAARRDWYWSDALPMALHPVLLLIWLRPRYRAGVTRLLPPLLQRRLHR